MRNICLGVCAGLLSAILSTGFVLASSQPYIADHGINIAIGNKYLTETDISIEGPVARLLFTRTYNSKSAVNGILGYGWSSTITEHLEFAGGSIIRVLPSGRHIHYGDDGSGRWVSQLGKRTTIAAITDGYELEKSDRTVNTYDTQGKLVQIEHRNGYILSFGYSGTELASISDNFGKTISFTYDSGKLKTLRVPTGTFIYTYENDNLVSVIKPDATIKHYEYEDSNDPHNITGVVDEAGIHTIHLTYYVDDRVETSSLNGIRQITITYPTTTTRTVTDGGGNQTTYQLEALNGVARVTSSSGPGCSSCGGAGVNSSYIYNSRQQVQEVTNGRGYRTSYTYDGNGNRDTVIKAVGTPEEQSISYTYDQTTNLLSSVSEKSVGNPDQYHIKTMGYDAVTDSLETVFESGYSDLTPISRATTYTPNSYGQIEFIDGPRKDVPDVTSFSYYPNDAAEGVNRGYLHTITNTLARVTTFSNYNALGRPERIEDPNSVVTTLLYDTNGRLTSKTTDARTVTYQYDDAGQIELITMQGGRILDYIYNTASGLLEKIFDSQGNYLYYDYDPITGKIKKRSIYRNDDVLAATVDYEYDSYGRLYKQINPDIDQSFQEYQYDDENNLEHLIDEQNNMTGYGYDGLNRLTSISQPGDVTTDVKYDSQDHQAEIGGDNALVTTYGHDDFGRKTFEQSPDTGTTLYNYDEADNLIGRTDNNSITAIYTYDALNRLELASFPHTENNVSYQYDQGLFGIGHCTTMIDIVGSSTYTYNQYGELTGETKNINGNDFSTGYQYDDNGEVAVITYPYGRVITYVRNTDGQVTTVDSDYQGVHDTLATNITYKPFGPQQTTNLANGITLGRGYDLQYRLTDSTAGSLYNRTYMYWNTGEVESITDHVDSANSQAFGYNALGMLNSATGSYGEIDFGYDGVGNRQTKTTDGSSESYTYFNGTNRLNYFGAAPLSFTYDLAGNTKTKGSLQYTWDDVNRLVSVSDGASELGSYQYDGNNLRVLKTSANETELFTYDPAGNLLAESKSFGLPQKDFVYLNGELLAFFAYEDSENDIEQVINALQIVSGKLNSTAQDVTGDGKIGIEDALKPMQDGVAANTVQSYYVISDHLGTSQLLANSLGQVVWAGEYTPFGSVSITTNTIDNDFRFPGQYYDSETRLHYNWHRFYDPDTGRYISADPIGLDGGINLYAYTENNPINLTDPTGLKCGDWKIDIFVPDSWWGAYDFSIACGNHDFCYGSCQKIGNSYNWKHKKMCDKQFKKSMLRECKKLTGTMRTNCESTARSYYNAVKNRGKGAYKSGQYSACRGCIVP